MYHEAAAPASTATISILQAGERVFVTSKETAVDSSLEIGPLPYGLYEVHIETFSGLYGRETVSVGPSDDIANIMLAEYGQIVGNVQGMVVQPQPQKPILFQLIDLSPVPAILQSPKFETNQDASFSFSHVPPGTYRLDASQLPPDDYVDGMTQDNRDVSREGIVVRDGETHVIVNLRRPAAALEGTVSDNSNRTISNAIVVLVPNSDNIPGILRVTFTNERGKFHIENLAPGAYRLFSWSDLSGAAYRNIEFMHQYEQTGSDITLMQGERGRINLQVLAEQAR
jgi:hypothetical protein